MFSFVAIIFLIYSTANDRNECFFEEHKTFILEVITRLFIKQNIRSF